MGAALLQWGLFASAAEMQRREHAVGIFWDIDNCQVPTGLAAHKVAEALQTLVKPPARRQEFICCTDVTTLSRDVRKGLMAAAGTILTWTASEGGSDSGGRGG